MPSRKLTVILNAAAGAKKADATSGRLARIFDANGLEAAIHELKDGREIAALVADAVRDGHHAVVAGGGDGTVSSVASGLVGSPTALGVLPLGTLNHFAKDVGIPLDIEEAALTIATGEVRSVDVGEVNGKYFINNSSIGLYPSIVRHREQEQRLGKSKRSALLWAVLAVMKRHKTATVSIVSDDGRSLARRTPLVFVGNNRYEMTGLKIGSRARLDGGTLVVYVLHNEGRFTILRMGIEAVIGRLRHGVAFDFLPTRSVRMDLKRKKTIHVATDGEVSDFAPPLEYRIHPKSLRVIVPAGAGVETTAK